MNNLNEEIKNISNKLDRVFYFVNPENQMLNKIAIGRISNQFAGKLNVKTYGTRFGPDVQDPKKLLEEIGLIGIEKFEIVCIVKEDRSSTLLSHENKEKFIEDLKITDKNSWTIAHNIILKDLDNLSGDAEY